jgi:hypothetical protein
MDGPSALQVVLMSKLRIAHVEDYETVSKMAVMFYSTTSQSKVIPYDEATAQRLFLDLVMNGFIILCEKDGKDVGMLGCMVTPAMLNNNYKVATELFWWVEPEARKGKDGLLMLKLAEQVAKVDGCSILAMGTLDNSPEGLGKVYEHLGYKRQEETWVKEL